MKAILDFLALVGMVLFVMIVCFLLLEAIFIFFFEVLWYIAMAAVCFMIVGGALRFLKAIGHLLGFGRYKRC